jgi:hypothetical protein
MVSTIETSLAEGCFSRMIVSTDDNSALRQRNNADMMGKTLKKC